MFISYKYDSWVEINVKEVALTPTTHFICFRVFTFSLCSKICAKKSCNFIVEKTLPCHHVKGVICSKDPESEQCTEKCTKLLACRHNCPGECYQSCNKQVCKERIEKLLSCGHKIKVTCFEQNNTVECQESCDRKLMCGHNCPNKCHDTCPHNSCKVRILKTLPCKHKKEMECHRSPLDVFCNSACERILPCGHSCLQTCGNACQRTTCSKLVDNTLPCGHLQAVRCGDYPNFVCKASCDKVVCSRGHRCKKKCHFQKQACGRCTALIKVKIPECNHEVLAECCEAPSVLNCDHPCQRILVCGHRCKLKCGENCKASVCKEKRTRKLQCGHTKVHISIWYVSFLICKSVLGFQLMNVVTYVKLFIPSNSTPSCFIYILICLSFLFFKPLSTVIQLNVCQNIQIKTLFSSS